MAKLNYLNIMDLIHYQERLRHSKSPSIHHFMVNEISYEYDKYPVWLELAGLLEATMKLEKGWWIDKDILE